MRSLFLLGPLLQKQLRGVMKSMVFGNQGYYRTVGIMAEQGIMSYAEPHYEIQLCANPIQVFCLGYGIAHGFFPGIFHSYALSVIMSHLADYTFYRKALFPQIPGQNTGSICQRNAKGNSQFGKTAIPGKAYRLLHPALRMVHTGMAAAWASFKVSGSLYSSKYPSSSGRRLGQEEG